MLAIPRTGNPQRVMNDSKRQDAEMSDVIQIGYKPHDGT